VKSSCYYFRSRMMMQQLFLAGLMMLLLLLVGAPVQGFTSLPAALVATKTPAAFQAKLPSNSCSSCRMIIVSNNKNCPRQKNVRSNFHHHRQSQLVIRESSSTDGGGETSQIQNSSSSSSSTENNDNDKDLLTINVSINEAKSTLKQLYILPILSLLSGLSPASRIIAESHISRIPDCPIAHDMDTLLLWPAISKTATTTPPSPPPTNDDIQASW
jgi:hypothetical protein